MSSSDIPKEKIEDILRKLATAINSKRELLYSAEENIKLGNQLYRQMEDLKKQINKISQQFAKEKSQIEDTEKIYKKMSKITEINIDSKTYEDDILIYVECESIVSNKASIMDKNSIENLNQDLEIFLAQIENQLINRENVEKLKKRTVSHIVPIHRKEFHEKNINPKELKSNEAIKSNISLKIKGKIQQLNDLKVYPNNPSTLGKELAKAEKLCEDCKQYTKYALILGCNCVLCIKCIKKMIESKKTIIDSTFEAQAKKMDTSCACLNHSCLISPGILQRIYGGNKIELSSIFALKKQLKLGTLTAKCRPNVCNNCKSLIKDETKSGEVVALCHKHKVCIKCHRYSYFLY